MSQRRAGVLLHPTCLPGPFGVGDLGPAAVRFLDWARDAGQTVWQTLPLGPTGHGDAPYGCLSAFAGNPALVSPDLLAEDGLLDEADVAPARAPSGDRLDHALIDRKRRLLEEAFRRFETRAPEHLRAEHAAFVSAPEQAPWLEDWCLFSALKETHGGGSWLEWERPLRRREGAAVEAARRELAPRIARARFLQFAFFRQWARLRDEARARGILVMGDLPIYIALDSADAWARPEDFELDAEGAPTRVAGVPPDYFSATGQLWGNPLYRWDVMERDGFSWWIARMRQNARLADVVRIDHFRGFAAYWAVAAGESTAIGGRWVPAPGGALFEAIRRALPDFPIVAEDLGMITPDVYELRDRFGFPGMKVLQFAFDEPDAVHAPHRHTVRTVAYTGTHDNDTTRGWFESCDGGVRRRMLEYTGATPDEPHWGMIRALYTSVAELAVVPLQDVAGLGPEARLNSPGKTRGNWQWRARPEHFRAEDAARLRRLCELTGRLPRP